MISIALASHLLLDFLIVVTSGIRSAEATGEQYDVIGFDPWLPEICVDSPLPWGKAVISTSRRSRMALLDKAVGVSDIVHGSSWWINMLTEYLQYGLMGYSSKHTENIVASYLNFQELLSSKMIYRPNVSAFEYAALRDAEDETNKRHASCRK